MKTREKIAPKRLRNRLAKSELWLMLAMTAARWEGEVGNYPDARTIPFESWPNDDPMRDVAKRYDLTGEDLARLCRQIADEVENRAVRAGYEDAWV